MAASYLSGVPRKKTALLEWNCSKDFAAMEKICKGKISKIEFFSILEVDYYKQSSGTVLADCLEKEYEYIIIDFGVLTKDNREDFVRCRRKLVIGSCIEWRLGAFMEILTNGRKGCKGWEYAVVFGSGQTKREIKKKLRIPFYEIPFSVDAYTVDSETLKFFQKFFRS